MEQHMPITTTDTLIDIIRHGEPEGGRRFRGNTIDDPLTEKGWNQMWQAIGDNHSWNAIVSSPLQRCKAFAEALGQKHDIAVTTDDGFKEVGFGAWEGKSPEEIIAADQKEYSDFYQDPVNNRPAGAEPLADFSNRVSNSLQQQLAQNQGKHLLIVAHAGVIRAIIGHVLQAEPIGWYRCRIDNGSISRIRQGKFGLKLEFHNRPSL